MKTFKQTEKIISEWIEPILDKKDRRRWQMVTGCMERWSSLGTIAR